MARTVITTLLVCLWASATMGMAHPQPHHQAPAPLILYDGDLEAGTPDRQGFVYTTLPFFDAAATQEADAGVTTLDTLAELTEVAGYLASVPLDLDPVAGFRVDFTLQLLAEVHNRPHRAGFSLLVISQDARRALELGFWVDRIWVQEGGGPPALFSQAEGVAFDTRAALIPYSLAFSGAQYTLYAAGQPILSGPLRNYTAFEGFPDPYETPNLIFLGDNSRTAAARVRLAAVHVIGSGTTAPPPLPTPTPAVQAQPPAPPESPSALGCFDLY